MRELVRERAIEMTEAGTRGVGKRTGTGGTEGRMIGGADAGGRA